jgi:hypothetical protein
MAAAAFLRFNRLDSNPGWYSDEGTLADIARNFGEGRMAYLAIDQSVLLAARMPIAPLLAALLAPLADDRVQALRWIGAGSGVLTAALVAVLVQRVARSRGLGLLSGAVLALYPPAVFYNRIGFSYNLLGPLVVMVLGGLWLYLEEGRRFGLAVAVAAVGLGSLVDLMALSLLGPLILVVAVRRGRDLAWAVPLALVPLLGYAAWMLASAPQAFGYDLGFIAQRLGAIPWWAQLPLVVLNFGTLLLEDPWWLPALAGLLLARPRRWSLLLLSMLVLPLILVGRSAGLAGLRRYSISPFFPLIAIGVAALVWAGAPWVLSLGRDAIRRQLDRVRWAARPGAGRWIADRLVALGSAGLLFLLVGSPLTISTLRLITETRNGFVTDHDWAYLPVGPAGRTADFVNRSAGQAVVIASPALGWALNVPTADFQQSLAYRGEISADYPTDVPRDRFRLAADYELAGLAVVDPIWREWGAVHLPGMVEMLEAIESWPVVWEEGPIQVYRNPGADPG